MMGPPETRMRTVVFLLLVPIVVTTSKFHANPGKATICCFIAMFTGNPMCVALTSMYTVVNNYCLSGPHLLSGSSPMEKKVSVTKKLLTKIPKAVFVPPKAKAKKKRA